MGRYIVMDVVFYGNSLNYDQGSGNYQELKKITKWDGRQYTLVSRYALRYSILETAKRLGIWNIAEGDKLQLAGEGDQKVIQPSDEILLSGEILEYPEFDLFGYLITSTDPQNFRIAPVKLSHAVSMTPFSYDALFNVNIGLANRMRKKYGEMKPNPFTAEEHETFYQYTVIIDLNDIGKIDIYINKKSSIGSGKEKWKINEISNGDKGIRFIVKKDKEQRTIEQKNSIKLLNHENLGKDLVHITYSLNSEESIKNRIKGLIRAILNLKRSIKGREEDLSPKLIVVGIYKNKPYKTYKDRITLVDEYISEEYDEIEEVEENGKKIYRVRHKVTKSRKPVFEIEDSNLDEPKPLNEQEVLELVDELFKTNSEEIEKVKIFYDPSISVKPPQA